MPKFNADEKVYEPIEVTLGGETYVIDKVTKDLFDEIKAVSEVKDNDILARQLGVIFGEEPSKFKDLDVRRASAVIKFVTGCIEEQIEGKND